MHTALLKWLGTAVTTALVVLNVNVNAHVHAAQTETWPSKPIKWVVPFSPGGANDLVARTAAEAVRVHHRSGRATG